MGQGKSRIHVDWKSEPITIATVVIAAATVINLFVSVGLWLATRDSVEVARHVYESANRPYVGLDGITPMNDREKRTINITAILKNFGTVPAGKFEPNWQVFINSKEIPGDKIPDKPSTLFPGNVASFHAYFGPEMYNPIMAGKDKLEIIIRSTYEGPGDKHYTYCEKSLYDPLRNGFFNLGKCD